MRQRKFFRINSFAQMLIKRKKLFHLLFVEDADVTRICESMGMTADAVYAWRSRIVKLARKLMTELSCEPPSRHEAGLP